LLSVTLHERSLPVSWPDSRRSLHHPPLVFVATLTTSTRMRLASNQTTSHRHSHPNNLSLPLAGSKLLAVATTTLSHSICQMSVLTCCHVNHYAHQVSTSGSVKSLDYKHLMRTPVFVRCTKSSTTSQPSPSLAIMEEVFV